MKWMSKKKILIFIDWYLPGFKAGGPIQSCANLIEHLSDEFDFYVVTRDSDYTSATAYPDIKANEWLQRPDGSQVYYFSQNQLTRKNIRTLIANTAYDIVYLNGIYSVYFTLYPLIYLRKKRDKLVVLAVRGMLAKSAIRVKKTKKTFFLRAVKILQLFNRVLFHATNEREKEDIERQFGDKARVCIAGNLASKNVLSANPSRIKESGSLTLVNIARISPEKNLLYALQILRKLEGMHIDFHIYGPVYDETYWAVCKQVISQMPPGIIVAYKGSLESAQVPAALGKYQFLFMPTAGENFGHVILQALGSGCPLLISDRTPWRNLQLKRCGWDIALEKEDHFVSAIRDCVAFNQAEFNLLSQNAFAFAKQYQNDSQTALENRRLFRLTEEIGQND
jgi:glycosyltransferase involved in cell wall biosynthesis